MEERSLPARFLQLLLFVIGGALCGLGAGLLIARGTYAEFDLSRQGILRAADAGIYDVAVPLLTGTMSLVLGLLVLLLGAVLALVAILLALKAAEKKGHVALALLIGLALGGGLAALTIFFGDGPARATAALKSAELGPGSILRATLWPRLFYALLIGATMGWAAAAAVASSWLRRGLLFVVVVVLAASAAVVVGMARPRPIDVPGNAPQLEAGAEDQEVPLWIIGGSKEARRVDVDLSVFFHGEESQKSPLKINRRNATRAQKAVKDYPLLHPRSSAAEQLLAASAMSDLNIEGTVEALAKSFNRRGNPSEGRLLVSFLGKAAPSPKLVKLLGMVSDPAQASLGSLAAQQLCPLATNAGDAAAIGRLGCASAGAATKVPLSQVKAKLVFKGRPLRRVPVGLIKAPSSEEGGWIKQGKVSAEGLSLLAGARTDVRGEVTLKNIPPGTYLLAVAPSRHQAKGGNVKLDREITIEVPTKAGVVDLGEIAAGGGARSANSRSSRGPMPLKVPSPTAVATTTIPNQPSAAAKSPAKTDSDDEDEEEPSKVAPTPAEPVRPLPQAAKRVVEKIRPAGSNRVSVPSDFAETLLEGDNSIVSPGATIEAQRTAAGRSKGLILRGIRPNGVEVALGFQDRDVIESVNGRPLREADDLVDLVDQLAGRRRVMVRIRRRGRPMILRIDVERD